MSSHFLLMPVLCTLLLMSLNKAVWSSNGSYDWMLHDSLFTSLQNEVHSDADIIIYYCCYYEFSELHSVRPCKGMYIQKICQGCSRNKVAEVQHFLPLLWKRPVQISIETPATLTESPLLSSVHPQQCWVTTFKYVISASWYSFSNSLFTRIQLFSTIYF